MSTELRTPSPESSSLRLDFLRTCDSQEIDQKRKLTMMTLFTLRWGRLKKKTKVAPEPA